MNSLVQNHENPLANKLIKIRNFQTLFEDKESETDQAAQEAF